MRHRWMNIQESELHLAATQAEMEILWLQIKPDEDAHTAQILWLYVAVFFSLLTLAVFEPSVSDIDVSHKGLQGAGWRRGVRERKYL